MSVIHLPPLTYIHVLDQTSNITSVAVGPQTLVLKDNEKLARDVQSLIIIPPQHFCVILNPISEIDKTGIAKLQHGATQVRFHGTPFPLYPGEVLLSPIKALPVVPPNHAIRLICSMDYTDDNGTKRVAGETWQLLGPLTYIPRAEVRIDRIVKPYVLGDLQALRIQATQTFVDASGNLRPAGSEWLFKQPGAYVPDVYENVLTVVEPIVLDNLTGLHVQALLGHTDQLGKKRSPGESWLVTREDTEYWIEDVPQVILTKVKQTVLSKRQYAVIDNPAELIEGKYVNQLGDRKLVVGPDAFFLRPGETIPDGIKAKFILTEDDGLLVKALIAFTDRDASDRQEERGAGDVWLITGPREYVPPITVQILEHRQAIKLSQNNGVYVRDVISGEIRLEVGPTTYMLKATEILWEKPISNLLREILKNGGGLASGSDVRKAAYFESFIDNEINNKLSNTSKAITYRVPHNTAVQISNYSDKTSRIVFGPDLVILGPHEDFNILSLSAGKPKVENSLKCLPLMLGPDFITDEIVVETADHARLLVRYAVNNHFNVEAMKEIGLERLFSIPDFIGFACRTLASRVRAAVAQTGFDDFHRHSASIIRNAVFGKKPQLYFQQNGLTITSIDIQYINPVDQTMSDLLMRSVQMAIEISTKSVEAAAQHEAKREEQASKARIERQALTNQCQSEETRIKLLELRAISAAVESSGQAKAEAEARAESLRIEGEAEITNTKLRVAALGIEAAAQLEKLTAARNSELTFIRSMTEIEINRLKEDADLEVSKFRQTVDALTPQTIYAIATAGPAMQLQLLQGLGIKATLITDGNSPINMFNVASGLVKL